MNMIMGMNLVNPLAMTFKTSLSSSRQAHTFYIEVDGKYVHVTKDADGNIVPVDQ